VACISDSMSRLVAGGSTLRPLHASGALCGPAVTVKTAPGDNLLTHMALNLAVEGDVVVDANGVLTNAIVGERMLAYCVAKKFAGIVIQ
jgi:regulator of RNase E activity RraA